MVQETKEFIGVVRLLLDYGFELVLENVFYMPTFRINLIFILVLENVDIFVHFLIV